MSSLGPFSLCGNTTATRSHAPTSFLLTSFPPSGKLDTLSFLSGYGGWERHLTTTLCIPFWIFLGRPVDIFRDVCVQTAASSQGKQNDKPSPMYLYRSGFVSDEIFHTDVQLEE